MALNLRNRLSRIRNAPAAPDLEPPGGKKPEEGTWLKAGGWIKISPGLWSRTVERLLPFPVPEKEIPLGFFSKRLHGLRGRYEDLVFFDLETTGLSGGTGTVAFLAACGVFTDSRTLQITQYFMDDYPAESSFVEAVNFVISNSKILVSYNGMCYDIPLFKTRCILNRIPFTAAPPHIDLVYAARRVWKTALPERSLSRVEKEILQIERIDDIPGRFVPEIWLGFVKTGLGLDKLDKVFKHNADDIFSLASLLVVFLEAALGKDIPLADPYGYAIMLSRFDPLAAILKLRILHRRGHPRALKPLLQLLRRNGQADEYIEIRSWERKNRRHQKSDRSPS